MTVSKSLSRNALVGLDAGENLPCVCGLDQVVNSGLFAHKNYEPEDWSVFLTVLCRPAAAAETRITR